MAYSSVTSILSIVPGLPQTTTDAGYSITSAIIGRHITRADALIDSKICKRYAVPISPTPPLLANISEDIVAYYIYRSFYTQDNYNKTEYFDELKSDAMKVLDLIVNSEINLIDTSGSQITEVTTGQGLIVDSSTNKQSFFDIDSDLEWKFNDDLIDEVERG